MNFVFLFTALLSGILMGCGGSIKGIHNGGEGENNDNSQKMSYLKWDAVPPEFNPSIDEIPFQTNGVEKINIDTFGFDKDVQVIYSSNLASQQGLIKIFKVWRNQASWGSLGSSRVGKNLDLKSYGNYQCSIRVQNGQIVELDGGCYVRVQIFMPVGSEVEVYNLGNLITKKFIPMDYE